MSVSSEGRVKRLTKETVGRSSDRCPDENQAAKKAWEKSTVRRTGGTPGEHLQVPPAIAINAPTRTCRPYWMGLLERWRGGQRTGTTQHGRGPTQARACQAGTTPCHCSTRNGERPLGSGTLRAAFRSSRARVGAAGNSSEDHPGLPSTTHTKYFAFARWQGLVFDMTDDPVPA